MSLLTEAQTAAIGETNPGLAITLNGVIYRVTKVDGCEYCERAHRVDQPCTGPYGDWDGEPITLGVVPAGQVLELIRTEHTSGPHLIATPSNTETPR